MFYEAFNTSLSNKKLYSVKKQIQRKKKNVDLSSWKEVGGGL